MPSSELLMDMSEQRAKAERLRSYQQKGNTIVLPNAWDAASARVFERTGFKAIATTSGGIAASYGYPDHEVITREEMLNAVTRITKSVSVPVTADMEAGYGKSPETVFETAAMTISTGAVGLNIEDSNGNEETLFTIEEQTARIRAAREAAESSGVDIVLNARVDVYLRTSANDSAAFGEAVRRGKAYSRAGADSVFYIGLKDLSTIEALVSEVGCPVNILLSAGSPAIADLKRAGVARITFGSGFMRSALTRVMTDARRLHENGSCDFLNGEILSHQEVNSMFTAGAR